LDKGLSILEYVASSKGAGYNEIARTLDLPQASVARYIKVLVEKEYIYKNEASGEYCVSEKMLFMTGGREAGEKLRESAEPILKLIKDRMLNTALFIHWNSAYFQCLAKETHEDSIVMQKVGEIRYDLFSYPWSAFVINELSERLKNDTLKKYTEPQKVLARLNSAYAYFLENGFVYYKDKAIRRLSVPVYKSGELLGAFGAGGTLDSMPENKIVSRGRLLREYADEFIKKINT
jgi:DNA-binding IclR family transcriptional regulator